MLPTNDARRPNTKSGSPRPQPTESSSPTTQDGGGRGADQDDNYDCPQHGSRAETVAVIDSGTRSIERTNIPNQENTELERATGASTVVVAAEVAVAGSCDDAVSNETTTCTGKPKGGRKEAASGVGSAAAMKQRNGASSAAANAGWAPGIALKTRGEDAPYTAGEIDIILSSVYWQHGRKLDVDYFNNMFAQHALAPEKAYKEGAALAKFGGSRNEIIDKEGSRSTGHSGKGKHKSPGGGKPAVEGSDGAAKNGRKKTAADSTPTTPMATSTAPAQQRKKQSSDGEQGVFSLNDSDATAVGPNQGGKTPSGAHRRDPADDHGTGVVGKPRQQSVANSRKKVRTSATAAANVVRKGIQCSARCAGDGARDCRCGDKDSDGDTAPSLPLRRLSSR